MKPMRMLDEREMAMVCGGMIDAPADEPWLLQTKSVNSPSNSSDLCKIGDAMQVAGASAAIVGGAIALYGLLTGPGEIAAGPIGGAVAMAGGAVAGAGYLVERAGGCK